MFEPPRFIVLPPGPLFDPPRFIMPPLPLFGLLLVLEPLLELPELEHPTLAAATDALRQTTKTTIGMR